MTGVDQSPIIHLLGESNPNRWIAELAPARRNEWSDLKNREVKVTF
jgi:hypothetical protein